MNDKPRAIVIIGDSFSNGDGVFYPVECAKRLGEDWVKDTDKLLHRRAMSKFGVTPVMTDAHEQSVTDRFNQWLQYHVVGDYSSKQYVESHHCWSKVLERYSGMPVVNLALPGGSTKSMTENLLVWCKKNEFFVRNHNISVMCNYGLRTRISVTSDVVLDPDNGYTPLKSPDPFQYSNTTLHYNPGANYDFDVSGYLVHCDLLEAYKFELCHSLVLTQTICDSLGMSFCWSGPHDLESEHGVSHVDRIKQFNFLDLPLPTDRCLENIHPAFSDIAKYTLWCARDQIAQHNFNPYSICSHYNQQAQNIMAQELNTLINENSEWFWN